MVSGTSSTAFSSMGPEELGTYDLVAWSGVGTHVQISQGATGRASPTVKKTRSKGAKSTCDTPIPDSIASTTSHLRVTSRLCLPQSKKPWNQ